MNIHILNLLYLVFILQKNPHLRKKVITQIKNKLTKYNIYETKIKITIYIINTIIYLYNYNY